MGLCHWNNSIDIYSIYFIHLYGIDLYCWILNMRARTVGPWEKEGWNKTTNNYTTGFFVCKIEQLFVKKKSILKWFNLWNSAFPCIGFTLSLWQYSTLCTINIRIMWKYLIECHLYFHRKPIYIYIYIYIYLMYIYICVYIYIMSLILMFFLIQYNSKQTYI